MLEFLRTGAWFICMTLMSCDLSRFASLAPSSCVLLLVCSLARYRLLVDLALLARTYIGVATFLSAGSAQAEPVSYSSLMCISSGTLPTLKSISMLDWSISVL